MKIQISLSKIGQVITREMYRQAKGNKAAATIVMNPADFLKLTTRTKEELKAIMDDALTLDAYNEYAKNGESIHMPWLDITLDGKYGGYTGKPKKTKIGRIVGHEGRHRAAALIKQGINKMVVLLNPREGGVKQYKKKSKPDGWRDTPYEKSDFPTTFYTQYTCKPVHVDLAKFKSLY